MLAKLEASGALRLKCGDLKNVLRLECNKLNFWMTGNTAHGKLNWVQAYATSPYVPHKVFLVWRVLLAIMALGVLAWSISSEGDSFWLIYLTHWMLLTSVCYLVFQTMLTLWVHLSLGVENGRWAAEDRIPPFVGLVWFLSLVAVPGGLFVCIMYWVLLAQGYEPALEYLVHGGVWAILTFDFLIGMQPFLLVQFVWFSVWGLAYGSWSAIHGAANLYTPDPYIYSVLDWHTKKTQAALFCFGMPIIVLPIMCTVIWATNFCRYQAIYKVSEANGMAIVGTRGLASQAQKPSDEV